MVSAFAATASAVTSPAETTSSGAVTSGGGQEETPVPVDLVDGVPRGILIADGKLRLGFNAAGTVLELSVAIAQPAKTGYAGAIGTAVELNGIEKFEKVDQSADDALGGVSPGWPGPNFAGAWEGGGELAVGHVLMSWPVASGKGTVKFVKHSDGRDSFYNLPFGDTTYKGTLTDIVLTNRVAVSNTTTTTVATPPPTSPTVTTTTTGASTTGGGSAPAQAPRGGVALAIIPTFLAAGAAMVASRKRSK